MRFELSQRAQLKLGQQLKLAPRVLQSMEILQMPMQALEERIETELESNVALEVVEQSAGGDGDEGVQQPAPPSASTQPAATGADRFARAEAMLDRSSDDDGGEAWRERIRLEGEQDSRATAFANIPSRGESLEEILLEQWALCEAPAPTMEAGRVILGYIGDNGFLTKSIAEIAKESSIDIALLEPTLKRLQEHLEPVGIAARDLVESLKLQLDALAASQVNHDGSTRLQDARILVEHHLKDMENNRLSAIRTAQSWSQQRLDDAREVLRHLDPAPARALRVENAPTIRPDVIIEFDAALDEYKARLASGVMPNLRVSEEYAQIAKAKRTDAATRDLINDGIRRANWFIDAIEQRGATLLRVVNEVIATQREWLDTGGGALKPLPMTQVARALSMHVSTVSRCVAGKWISTPRGSYELRKLFSGGTETQSGSDISWEGVRVTVGEIIASEDRANPLSDEAIVAALKEKGITLARRTVVKYREQLGIPVARIRRSTNDG